MTDKETFIEKATAKHKGKYDYTNVDYKDRLTKVCINCPEHGEFWQTPKLHLRGCGCPKCGRVLSAQKTNGNKSFIAKAKSIHGNKYDYSKVEYANAYTKVCIICSEHGEFLQTPHDHLKGCGCPKCREHQVVEKREGNGRIDFIEKAKKVHGDKYDYSKVEYINNKTKVCIVCPIHGEFWQIPSNHLRGCGCPKCSAEVANEGKSLNREEFIRKARQVHGDKYDYSKVEYKGYKSKVCIVCPEHGEFWQTPDSHLQGSGCPKCGAVLSKNEEELYKLCCDLLGSEAVVRNDRTVLDGKEIDIYIPSKDVGIEYNGLLWHSDKFNREKNYHYDKMMLSKKKGIRLIQIFEDEYVNHKEIVISKVKHLLGVETKLPKIMGRKCVVRGIDSESAKAFLETNHIQGYASGSVHLGAFCNDILVGVMSFKNYGKNKWELIRFASDNTKICQGVGGKLFKYFVKIYGPLEVKSFADRRWTTNENDNLYIKLGFMIDGYTAPDYHYFNPNEGLIRFHKFNFRKQTLHKKYGLPLTMTETEMTKVLGYYKVFDCGLIRYVWKNTKQ